MNISSSLLYFFCRNTTKSDNQRRHLPYTMKYHTSRPSLVLICTILASLTSPSNARPLELEELLEMDIVDLVRVQIETASRKPESIAAAPSVISVITARDIEGFGANNLLDILNRVTSLQVIGSHFYSRSISIRGQMISHSNNDVLFLINGRPHRTSWNGGTPERLLLAFPIETIERIEIIRGPGSVLYGTGAVSGVVNIFTKPASSQTSGAGITIGSQQNAADSDSPFASRGLHMTTAYEGEEASITAGLKVFDTDGWIFTATDEQGVTQSVERGETNIGAMLSGGLGGFSVDVLYTDVNLDNIIGGPPVWPAGYHNTRHLLLDAGFQAQLTQSWSFDNHITYNNFNFDFDSSENGEENRDSNDVLLESTLSGKLFNRLDILAGVNYESIQGTISPTLDYTSYRYSVFGEVDYLPVEFVKLTAGFQWNKVQNTDSDVSPRLGLVFNFSPQWGAKLLYGEAFRSAVATERFLPADSAVVGNESLDPEKIATTELQFFFTSPKSYAALTFFESEITDVIDRVSIGGGQFRFENVGSVDSRGIELEGKTTFLDRWMLTGSTSYQQNENGNGADATLAPNWMAKLGLVYRHSNGIDFGIYDSYFGAPTPVRDVNPSVLEVNPEPRAYHYLTANLSLDVRRFFGKPTSLPMRLSLYADNLLNEDVYYPEISRRNINSIPLYSGRALYATFSVAI